MAQQGKLSLDDDVHKYIPELPDFGALITLRELMHYTSGLRDQWALLDLAGWRYSQDLITDDDVRRPLKINASTRRFEVRLCSSIPGGMDRLRYSASPSLRL